MGTLFRSLFGYGYTQKIQIEFPALDNLVGFLRELDARDQLAVQEKIDQLTRDLKLTNETIQQTIKEK